VDPPFYSRKLYIITVLIPDAPIGASTTTLTVSGVWFAPKGERLVLPVNCLKSSRRIQGFVARMTRRSAPAR
jgi:hypothetical protein